MTPSWWENAVFYQVYVRSFADSDGDGVGDLAGVESRLDYLARLGVDALWLTPFYPSPMVDHGYDITHHRDVDPIHGDLAAFDSLLAAAHERGLKVTVDVVPNHVSDRHPWFAAALAAGPGSPERARFHFRDGQGHDGALPPNNWPSVFGGPAWTRVTEPDGSPGQWYLHLFAAEQPDLNWDHPDIAADFERTLRFWLDRGVDGFRVDVADAMGKLASFRDLTPDELADPWRIDHRVLLDHEGAHRTHRLIRRVLDEYPDTMSVGEISKALPARLRRYVRDDELHLVFDFGPLRAAWDARQWRAAVAAALDTVAGMTSPCWALGNHDKPRVVTRYGGGEAGTRRARAATLLMLALPGVSYLYNGDELGLPDVRPPAWAIQDPRWLRMDNAPACRDDCRIPMPWEGDEPPYGFSTPGTATWLPIPAGWSALAVASQERDPTSTLELHRTALAVRRKLLRDAGGLTWIPAPEGCLAFRRDNGVHCFVNFTDAPVTTPLGEVLVASEPVTDQVPAEAAVWWR